MQELTDKEGHWKVWEGAGSVILTHGLCTPKCHELSPRGIHKVCEAMCMLHVKMRSGAQPFTNPP